MTAEDRKRYLKGIKEDLKKHAFVKYLPHISELVIRLEVAYKEIDELNHIVNNVVEYGLPSAMYEGSIEQKKDNRIQKLEAQLLAAKAAIEFFFDHWGTTDPEIKEKGYKVSRDALTTLSDIESAEACVEVTCFKDHDTVWDASEQPGTDDTHKGILIVKKRKEGGAE